MHHKTAVGSLFLSGERRHPLVPKISYVPQHSPAAKEIPSCAPAGRAAPANHAFYSFAHAPSPRAPNRGGSYRLGCFPEHNLANMEVLNDGKQTRKSRLF